ncbi:MAG TPA: non-homologous end-joining DNA ligase [Candidatus Binatia bacterium]
MALRSTLKIAGKEIELSNLGKVMYPETGFTKGHVIDYYRRVAPALLPHLRDRPVTLIRFPDGVEGEHFYEKNAPPFTPRWIKTFSIARSSVESTIRYILINDPATLVWTANIAGLEIHPLLAKAPHIEVPTMIVFDLDPGEDADILNSCEVALLIRDLLARLKLQSFVKVSGSKGIHLHVPLNTNVTYEATQPFAKSIAQWLESEHPDLVVSEMSKAKRKGKVFVDWSQNSEHKSTVAVYSLRAKRGRPFVALPLSWEELEKALEKADAAGLFFEPEAALKRLKKSGDLFAPVAKLKQKLPRPFLELEGDPPPKNNRSGGQALETYRQKRDFTRTPEPPPALPRSSRQGGRRLFVIQKHAASRLHYDLRLEMQGVLKSWAAPKGPPYELNEKRLAMATEDHPMEYARFEGIIPQGQYGGGTVMVWDIGAYEIMDGNYWKGKMHIFFSGSKLKGEWVLVRKDESDGKKQSWLWIKAGTGMKPPPANKEDSSALTARSMAEIAAAQDAVWHSNRNGGGSRTRARPSVIDLESLPERKASFIEPMQSLAVGKPPEGAGWLYEVKLDGYRCLAVKKDREVTLFSRNKKSLNARFPQITRALESLESETVLDGEIVALDRAGHPSFNLLQNRRAKELRICFYVFDLLVYRGKSLLQTALDKRRRLLESVIAALPEPIRLSETFAGQAEELIAAARELGLEGLIAKREESVYEPGKRSGAWTKYRIHHAQEFVIGGYAPGADGFESLLAGYYQKDKLLFIGKIKNGFVSRTRREIAARFKGLETDLCPFANLPEKKGARPGEALTVEAMKKCRWLEPKLLAQIEFADWTEADRLRDAKFAGLRDDKEAREVVREYPVGAMT